MSNQQLATSMNTIPDDVLREALSKVTGDNEILAAELHWDLRNPCADCPFMKTTPYHQGVAKSIPGVVESINEGRFAHTCHKTDSRKQCDGPVAGKETGKPVQHCIGSILMLAKTGNGKDLQLPFLQAIDDGKISAEEVRKLIDRAKSDPNVFTIRGFIHFYRNKLMSLLGKESDAQET